MFVPVLGMMILTLFLNASMLGLWVLVDSKSFYQAGYTFSGVFWGPMIIMLFIGLLIELKEKIIYQKVKY